MSGPVDANVLPALTRAAVPFLPPERALEPDEYAGTLDGLGRPTAFGSRTGMPGWLAAHPDGTILVLPEQAVGTTPSRRFALYNVTLRAVHPTEDGARALLRVALEAVTATGATVELAPEVTWREEWGAGVTTVIGVSGVSPYYL